nr:hypothetical protein [Tanacetum cinerariifolium]
MPIISNEPPDPPFDELCNLTKVTSAKDLCAASFNDTKVKVMKVKHCKPHRGIKVSTPGSTDAGSILRRLRSAKFSGKARDRSEDSPRDNRGGKRMVSAPMDDEINKGGIAGAKTDIVNDRDMAGSRTLNEHTRMEDVVNTGGVCSSSQDDDEEDVESDGEGIARTFAWNVRGLNNTPNQDKVIQILREDDFSLCGLLETHVKKKDLFRICNRVLRNWDWASNISSCTCGTRIIVGWDPNSFFCSFVYVDIHTVDRRSLWKALHKHKLTIKDKPWVILGDFNACLDPSKRSSDCLKVTTAMNDFWDCVSDIEVEDIAMSGLRFTWNKKPGVVEGIFKKLDRVLGNVPFMTSFPTDFALFLPFMLFDHTPDVFVIPEDSWNVVGSEVCNAVKDFFKNGKILKEINATVISFVPKIDTPSKVFDFCPIACCNVIYKIIFKVISNRLKGVLGSLVDENQCAFIPSRQISDNILLSQELMRGTTLIEGMSGLRQMDPLSPYLFMLVMEVFNLVLKRQIVRFASILKKALDEFRGMSGLLPSKIKSVVFW